MLTSSHSNPGSFLGLSAAGCAVGTISLLSGRKEGRPPRSSGVLPDRRVARNPLELLGVPQVPSDDPIGSSGRHPAGESAARQPSEFSKFTGEPGPYIPSSCRFPFPSGSGAPR
jgi:hypothetical protein